MLPVVFLNPYLVAFGEPANPLVMNTTKRMMVVAPRAAASRAILTLLGPAILLLIFCL